MGRLLAILWVRSGLRDVAQFAVRGPEASIGRDPDNTLVLDSPAVSAHHGRLTLAGGVWTLTDLDSINGSWVDGERLEGSLPLTPGSEVRIADVVLSFAPRDEWSDSPASEPVSAAPPALSGPLFLPVDDSVGPRRLLIGATVLVILGLVAYLLLVRR
jgi:predicted component of type VI protein secretion system